MVKRGAGINIPVFSLRSKKSLGIGEFYDLIPLIDWAKEAGLKVIQILPIHDTTLTETDADGNPYGILSAFSLHPIYLNLQALAPEYEEVMRPFVKELNLPQLHYARTFLAKKELLRMLFIIRGEQDLKSKSFESFFHKNEAHLKAYAAFCVLKDKHQTADFRKWGRFSKYSEILVEEVCEKNEEVQFHYFVQYHCDKQLKHVVHHAREQGILLKGDFPMGVLQNSVETWRFSEYFQFDKTIGAPPDFYNHLGQNWGFPSFNWDEIKEENFFWLKSRLRWMEQYFDMIRLDHVLGYFRLWEIPIEQVRGLMGNFSPAHGFNEQELEEEGLDDLERLCQPYGDPLPKGLETQRQVEETFADSKKRDQLFKQIENVIFLHREESFHPRIDVKSTSSFKALPHDARAIILKLFDAYYFERQEELWRERGLEKLKVIKKYTSLEVCVEDIGVIPKCVGEVLKELHFLNLHVQRMPKSFDVEFEDPKQFPQSCVCMPSNHDTAPLRLWWEEDEEATKRYYQKILKGSGQPPKELTEKLAQEIIQAHLNSKAKWAIFLLQDIFAMNESLRFPDPAFERINDPADIHYVWEWRMHLYLEELLLAKSFTKSIRKMVEDSLR